MGTVFTIDAVAFDPDVSVDELIHRACAGLHRVDDCFSTWRDDTPMSRLRRGTDRLSDVPKVIGDVLALCEQARDVSGGWFDPWAAPGGVDPTGVVKGWAAQQALATLRDGGANAALVNAAGDVTGFGGPKPGQPWRIAVTDPHAPMQVIDVVSLEKGGIAVSGTYERGPHIFDPRTGTAATSDVISSVVIGPDLWLADAIATALVAGGKEAARHVLRLAEYSATLIFTDGSRST